jgi:hypothetical protein
MHHCAPPNIGRRCFPLAHRAPVLTALAFLMPPTELAAREQPEHPAPRHEATELARTLPHHTCHYYLLFIIYYVVLFTSR